MTSLKEKNVYIFHQSYIKIQGSAIIRTFEYLRRNSSLSANIFEVSIRTYSTAANRDSLKKRIKLK